MDPGNGAHWDSFLSTVGLLLMLGFALDGRLMLLAQSDPIRFSHLTVEDGLSQNTVRCIFQDRDGFLWFGTQHGLNKYDGHNFTVYHHDPLDPNSIPNHDVSNIQEDRGGNLWFLAGSFLCRLARQDKHIGRFTSRTGIGVDTFCIDDSNRLWLGTADTLYCLDPVITKITQRIVVPATTPRGIRLMTTAFKDREGDIWFGASSGEILRLSQVQNQCWGLSPYAHTAGVAPGFTASSDGGIQAEYDDLEKSLWIGMSGGLCRMRLHDNDSVHCEHYLASALKAQSLSSNWVHTVFKDKAGTLWVGTTGGGLCKLVWENGAARFVRYQHDPADPNSLSDNDVWSIYQDRSGMIWVGTNGGGLNKFDPEQIKFRHYRRDPARPGSLPDNVIWSFYEDHRGDFWIGTNSGLAKLTQRNEREAFAHFPTPVSVVRDNSTTQVRTICEDREETLWLGTLGRGLGKLNRTTETFEFFVDHPADTNSLGSNNIYALYCDSANALWIGMNSGDDGAGFAKMWREGQRMQFKKYLRSTPGIPEKLAWVIAIAPSSRRNQLWLGTWGKGLLRFDTQHETFTPYLHHLGTFNPSNHGTVFAIYEDKAGMVWLGTYGGGLAKLDPDKEIFRQYTTRDGLADNVIYAILPDDYGNLWLSTNKGIAKFNPSTENFQNFDVTNGLQGDEFNLGAALRSQNGEMFFGGSNGFNRFHPAKILITVPPEIVLTAFKKFGKPVLFNVPLTEHKTITLSHHDDFFAFEFAALHYKNPAKNRYAYKLEGFDRDWIQIGNKREASYTNLDPGDYVFRVKAANSDGIWSEKGLAIHVKIVPPFWRTWWFYLLVSGALVFVIAALHRYRLQRALAMERLKTRERERLQKQVATDFHDNLGHRLTKIYLSANILKQQFPQLPLPTFDTLDKIAANAAQLSREKDEFIWKLDPEKDSLYHLAEQWKNFSDELFDRNDIAFQLAGLSKEFDAIPLPENWKQNLYLIFKEAMHNVLKHASGCRNVTLSMAISDGILQVSLTDDGSGFDPTNGRNGHGLQNMRERAQQLGGKIEIFSKKDGGATVSFVGKLPERPVDSRMKMPILKKVLHRLAPVWLKSWQERRGKRVLAR